jgi:PTS system mannose-specific IIA component
MFGILVVTHGEMASGIIDATKMIIGEDEEKNANRIQLVTLKEGESPQTLHDEIEKRIKQMAESGIHGVLILTDLFGSSTTNAGVNVMLSNRSEGLRKGFEISVVSGLNLPMVLELIPALKENSSIKELTKIAVDTGRKSILDVADELAKRKRK